MFAERTCDVFRIVARAYTKRGHYIPIEPRGCQSV